MCNVLSVIKANRDWFGGVDVFAWILFAYARYLKINIYECPFVLSKWNV